MLVNKEYSWQGTHKTGDKRCPIGRELCGYGKDRSDKLVPGGAIFIS